MTALIPRATVEDIVRFRNEAIALYGVAYEKIAEAQAAVEAASGMARRASPGINGYNYAQADEVVAFRNAVSMPERERYLRTARRLIDIDVWAYVVQRTDLERLMDTEAKKKLRDQMAYIPERVSRDGEIINGDEIAKGLPEPTVENITATIEQFVADAGTIFRRGIANVFSKLDRRFRSHDGFKVGSRVILTRVFSEWGRFSYGETRDKLVDIERVLSVLDDKPEASFTSALNALEHDRRGGGARQSEVETEYFLIRGFKNGNAHLWFKRDDLLEKVNKLLAEWYGEVIGDGQAQEADPLNEIKTTPARRYGFFPTPASAAEKVIGELPLSTPKGAPALRVLEPSAGTGNLARLAAAEQSTWNWEGRERVEYACRAIVDCIEIQPHLAAALEAEGIYGRVFARDFLTLSPDVTGLYDRIVMNPPFDRERDIDHVNHALKFLRPGGVLIAIMSAGTEHRTTRKAVAFRALMESLRADWRDLPAGSFSEVGTNVNTLFVKVKKP